MPPGDDLELLAAWRTGDAAAGSRLMERHYPAVLRFFTFKAPRVAEDLAQRTFLGCVEGLERLRADTSFKAYLFAIAQRQLLWWLRDNRRADARFGPADALDEVAVPSGSQIVASRQEQLLLLRALHALPDELRQVVGLHYWEELSSAEIEVALGVPSSTIRGRLVRARTLLAEQVGALGRDRRVVDALVGDLEGWIRALVDRGGPAARL